MPSVCAASDVELDVQSPVVRSRGSEEAPPEEKVSLPAALLKGNVSSEVTVFCFVHRFHMYVIGTEECERSIAQSAINTNKDKWEQFLKEALGPDYSAIRSHTLQVTLNDIFRRSHKMAINRFDFAGDSPHSIPPSRAAATR